MTKSEFTEKLVSNCADLTAEDVQVAVNTLFIYKFSTRERWAYRNSRLWLF